jgi:hypothetical protein
MSTIRRLATRTLATLAVASILAVPLPAAADGDPIFLGWSSLLPPLDRVYTPDQATDCRHGAPGCVVATLAEMSRRFGPLATSCDHNAVFSLAYLRTTQRYQQAAAEPRFFADTPWVNHEDAVFGDYYFQAYDDWAAGNRTAVPKAWVIAFDAARGRTVSGSGDLVLGMNAHVNRDLPYVLASLGLVAPDGTSRKADHDQVNVFLNQVVAPLLQEESNRFDPTVDDTNTPYGLSDTALFQLLEGWRETAWRNAERLVAAPDEATRALVSADIEQYAARQASLLRTQYAYVPPLTTTQPRDAYCAVHHG